MLMTKAGSSTAVPPSAPRTRWRGPGVSPSRAADSRQRLALLGPSTPGLLDQNANEAERCAEYNLSPFFPKLLLFTSPFPCRLFLFLCSLSLSLILDHLNTLLRIRSFHPLSYFLLFFPLSPVVLFTIVFPLLLFSASYFPFPFSSLLFPRFVHLLSPSSSSSSSTILTHNLVSHIQYLHMPSKKKIYRTKHKRKKACQNKN